MRLAGAGRASTWVLAACGIWLVVLGLYFIGVRPPLLPEDTRFMGTTPAAIRGNVPGLERWHGNPAEGAHQRGRSAIVIPRHLVVLLACLLVVLIGGALFLWQLNAPYLITGALLMAVSFAIAVSSRRRKR